MTRYGREAAGHRDGRAAGRAEGGWSRAGRAVAVLTVACLGTAPALRAARPAAVVLVTIDTLRADHVSFNGYRRVTTPYLDSLAEGGTVFERAYAPSSWTPPSMASLFTGLYPSSHGIHYGRVVEEEEEVEVLRQPRLPASLVTLAERLRAAGYRTLGVHSNLHLAARLGFDQGFEEYLEPGIFPAAPEVVEAVRRGLTALHGADWKQRWKQEPTFLWIHCFDPHDPYFARRPWIERFAPDFGARGADFPAGLTLRGIHERFADPGPQLAPDLAALYDSEIAFVDDRLRLLGEELGLADPGVLLIVTSDHGEGLLEHGQVGHGMGLWEEQLRVPLLVRWPAGGVRAGATAARATLLDLYPTVLELAGEAPAAVLPGSSLAPLLRDGRGRSQRPLFFEVEPSNPPFLEPEEAQIAVLDGDWKLIRPRRSRRPARLYHLPTDPGELRDLAAGNRRRVRRLEKSLRAWLDGLPAPPADLTSVPLEDEELRKRLEALGYVGADDG